MCRNEVLSIGSSGRLFQIIVVKCICAVNLGDSIMEKYIKPDTYCIHCSPDFDPFTYEQKKKEDFLWP